MNRLFYGQRGRDPQDEHHWFKGYLKTSLRFCVGLGMVSREVTQKGQVRDSGNFRPAAPPRPSSLRCLLFTPAWLSRVAQSMVPLSPLPLLCTGEKQPREGVVTWLCAKRRPESPSSYQEQSGPSRVGAARVSSAAGNRASFVRSSDLYSH